MRLYCVSAIPGHLALAGAHIGGGHVLRRVEFIVAFDQLIGETDG